MINIVVCDDCAAEREQLARLVREHCAFRGIHAAVHEMGGGAQLLERFDALRPEIIFLDIYMNDLNGVETARRIRETGIDSCLFFTTSSADFALEGYELGALHYLVKPVTQAAVADAMARWEKFTPREEKRIATMFRRVMTTTLLSDILYVEVYDKVCFMHTAQGIVKTYLSMDEMLSRLNDERFLRCHRSYIVNLQHVKGIAGLELLLKNGERVPVRRGDKDTVKRAFNQYLINATRLGGPV